MAAAGTPFRVAPLERSFGAVITGLTIPGLSDEDFESLYRTWLEYALLVFPAQHLDDEQQVAFARRFGDLVPGLELAELSYIRPDGSLRDAPDDDMMSIIRGNMHWHQDNTYMPLQAKGAVFSARIVPARAVSYTHLRAHETNDLISYAVLCL